MYQISDDEGVPIYVGRTVNETQRAAAHQRTATSNCKRLAQAIVHLKSHSPTWTFAKNLSRVRGLEHGIPEEEAPKYEAYFIYTLDTVHHKSNVRGCNSREGDDAVRYEKSFPEISSKLSTLKDGESLFSAADRHKRLKRLSEQVFSTDVLESEAQLEIVSDVRNVCIEEVGTCPQCVEDVYALVEAKCKALSNMEATVALLKSLRKKYTAMDHSILVNNQTAAADFNGLKMLLVDFLPHEENTRQKLAHNFVLVILKQVTRSLKNGETMTKVSFTPKMTVDSIKLLEHAVAQRNDTGGLPGNSFAGRIAWCNPNSKLKGDLQTNLERTQLLLGNTMLTTMQRQKATEMLSRIKEAIAATTS